MSRLNLVRPLTAREEHVVQLLAQEFSTQSIADQLGIAPATVRAHVERAAMKVPGTLSPRARLISWWRGATLEVLG